MVEDTCIIEANVTIYGDVTVESHGAGKEIRIDDHITNPTEEDIDPFAREFNFSFFMEKVVSLEEEEKALLTIEEALNMVPTEVMNNSDRMSLLRNAFDVLSSLDESSILRSKQRAEWVSMKYNFIGLAERAGEALKDKNLFAHKEVIKTTFDRKIERYRIELDQVKEEIEQKSMEIVHLRLQMKMLKMNNLFSLKKKKQMLKVSEELKAELDVLVKNWPDYEAKMKAAEEVENVVGTEWSKMKELFSSLRN